MVEQHRFESRSTVKFQQKMRPYALEVYTNVFPGCWVEDLREDGDSVHVLDQSFGIDSLIHLPSGQWISLQEKYREYENLEKFGDFTQGYKKAAGTKYESDGEWFHLAAQIYFYGWANKRATGFYRWLLLDVVRYKLVVEKAGGLEKIGEKQQNAKHGRTNFFGIPTYILAPAIIADNFSLNGIGQIDRE